MTFSMNTMRQPSEAIALMYACRTEVSIRPSAAREDCAVPQGATGLRRVAAPGRHEDAPGWSRVPPPVPGDDHPYRPGVRVPCTDIGVWHAEGSPT